MPDAVWHCIWQLLFTLHVFSFLKNLESLYVLLDVVFLPNSSKWLICAPSHFNKPVMVVGWLPILSNLVLAKSHSRYV